LHARTCVEIASAVSGAVLVDGPALAGTPLPGAASIIVGEPAGGTIFGAPTLLSRRQGRKMWSNQRTWRMCVYL
jgi:hypothetical protein